ncbi:MAG: Fe-S-binding domain-containing protein, partial [Acidimicrobiales bacterium]|nr:Fe-S-binding domain-containing protein [Acidimicrobiales bacterium]
MTTAPFPVLNFLIWVPAAGALLCLLTPASAQKTVARTIGLVASVAELGLAVYLAADFAQGQAGFQFVSQHSWIGAFGISWKLGVDGISLFLVV